MSEQTPETSANSSGEVGFIGSDAEPSMEDILASIRKIIADDADPLPLDGPSDDNPIDLSIQSVGETVTIPDTRPAPVAASADTGSDSLDIEALLAGFDDAPAELATPETMIEGTDEADVLTLGDDLIIPEITDDETSILDISALVEAPADVDVGLPSAMDDDANDMDRLMNELLVDLDDVSVPAEAETVASTAETLPQSEAERVAPVKTATPVEATTDADLDLVKSLMADLTDEDEAPVETADAELDTDTDIDPLDALEGDILDSILDMTLDDEIAAMDAQIQEEEAQEADTPSLADIAAAAESDAGLQPSAEAAQLGGATLAASKDPVIVAKPAPVKPKPNTPEMETPMPSAIRSDAILDDVTEEATMSAFAQLNQVVEDKAILSERGPRVGDLVQDALRPMLKDWLDENLQGIVERAVAKEVQRLATGK